MKAQPSLTYTAACPRVTRIGSLCSGYGGLEMGVQSVIGGAVAWHAEYDDAPSKILAHHWPEVPNLRDITAVDWNEVEPVDVLTAGYPCQPFSPAGKRQGENDARHLWPHVGQAVRVLRPRLVVLENVAGHLSLGFGRVLGDLAAFGYDARWVRLRASDVGAPHGRARVFVVAEDANSPAGGERWLAAPGQAEGRGPRTDARGRSGAPASDAHVPGLEGAESARRLLVPARRPAADSLGGELQRRGVGGVLGAAPRGTEGARGERERDGHAAGDRRAAAPDTAGDSRWFSDGDDVSAGREGAEWGEYAGAVGRWAAALRRPAPAPTEPGRNGKPRLSPRFVEWMMGLPAGHVTDVDIPRNAQLKALGNGVVPQQAEAAVRWLLAREAAA